MYSTIILSTRWRQFANQHSAGACALDACWPEGGGGCGCGGARRSGGRCLCDGSRRSVLRSGVRPVRPLVRIGRSNEFSVSASGRGGNARQPWRVLFGFSAAESCSGVVFRSWQARRIWVGIAELEADNLSRHPHEIADGPHSPVVL